MVDEKINLLIRYMFMYIAYASASLCGIPNCIHGIHTFMAVSFRAYIYLIEHINSIM